MSRSTLYSRSIAQTPTVCQTAELRATNWSVTCDTWVPPRGNSRGYPWTKNDVFWLCSAMEIKALTLDGVDGVHERHLQQMLQCQMPAIATCVLMTNWTERGEAINAMTAYDILWQIMMTFMWTSEVWKALERPFKPPAQACWNCPSEKVMTNSQPWKELVSSQMIWEWRRRKEKKGEGREQSMNKVWH